VFSFKPKQIYIIVVLLGIYPQQLNIKSLKETCTQMFIAVLFIVVKMWKQQKGPSGGE
jgi:hypothetical protein